MVLLIFSQTGQNKEQEHLKALRGMAAAPWSVSTALCARPEHAMPYVTGSGAIWAAEETGDRQGRKAGRKGGREIRTGLRRRHVRVTDEMLAFSSLTHSSR